MEPLSPEQLAKLPGRTKALGDLIKDYDVLREHDRTLQARWILGLSVANGGALAALAAKILDLLGLASTDQSRAVAALSLPSLWFFVAGLALAGMAGLQEILRNQRELSSAHQSIRIQQHIKGSITQDQLEAPNILGWSLEVASGLAFFGGLTYPLVVLGIRYWFAGVIDW